MTSQTKLQWCAMLAKLVAPMEAERAAKAFADMLPLLPEDDHLYTKASLERVAKCDRKTAVPTFGDIDAALSDIWRESLPVHVRMGGTGSSWPALDAPKVSQTDRDAAIERSRAVVGELRAIGTVIAGDRPETKPSHLSALQCALDVEQHGGVMRQDWAQALEAFRGDAK